MRARSLAPRLVALSVGLWLAACAPASPTPVPDAGRITADQVEVLADQVSLRGTTSLPDEACLFTQLTAGGMLIPDWPTDCLRPSSGAWQLSVALGQRGQPPALNPTTAYQFHIWLRDQPGVAATLAFDVASPPVPR